MNGETPLVTILMPCRNAKASFFREALRSVFSQNVFLWKLAVIDDHTDAPETLEVLGDLPSGNDHRVSVLPNDGNYLTGALNTGMRHATTPFVCALHCDDLLCDQAVQTVNAAIRKYPHCHYFHSSRQFIDGDGNPLSPVYSARGPFSLPDFRNGCPVKALHCWKATSGLAIGGMDESATVSGHGADDYDFPWRMAEAGFSFQPVPECLYYIRDHREHYRLTTHVPLDSQISALRMIFAKHGLSRGEIEEGIRMRRAAYLRQALYEDEEDKKQKDQENYDIRKGWRLRYD